MEQPKVVNVYVVSVGGEDREVAVLDDGRVYARWAALCGPWEQDPPVPIGK